MILLQNINEDGPKLLFFTTILRPLMVNERVKRAFFAFFFLEIVSFRIILIPAMKARPFKSFGLHNCPGGTPGDNDRILSSSPLLQIEQNKYNN